MHHRSHFGSQAPPPRTCVRPDPEAVGGGRRLPSSKLETQVVDVGVARPLDARLRSVLHNTHLFTEDFQQAPCSGGQKLASERLRVEARRWVLTVTALESRVT